MDLILLLWLLLDNAELLAHACLFAVAAVAWVIMSVFGLWIVWIFS